MEIFFLKNYICVEETSPRPFSKQTKLNTSLYQQSEILQLHFVVFPSRELPEYVETRVMTTCLYLI